LAGGGAVNRVIMRNFSARGLPKRRH